MITNTVQTQSPIILNEKNIFINYYNGPVRNSDSWTRHSNQNFPVNGGVLKRNPEDISALNLRGAVLYDLERYDEAIESFDKALEINSENVIALK